MSTVDFDALVARAFHKGPAVNANAEIAAVRDGEDFGGGPALSYELVADRAAGLAAFADKVLPRLVYFLDCRGVRLPQTPGIFVSLFLGDEVLFFDAGELVDVLAEVSGQTLAQLVARFGSQAQSEPGN